MPETATESETGSAAGAAQTPTPAVPPPAGSPKVFLVLLGLVLALVAGYEIGLNAHGTTPSGIGLPGGHSHAGGAVTGGELAGLAVSAGGYSMAAQQTRFTAGVPQQFQFQILGSDGAPVPRYLITSDRPLHLIVARRDLSGYQHLHPTLGPDNVWSVPLTLPRAGEWRAFADFAVPSTTPGVSQVAVALGVDLAVPGDYQPVPPPPVSAESSVDGYTVTFGGTPQVGSLLPMLLRVYRNGQLVTELEPYLGSYGHLVVLREGDMGYLHVHPDQQLAGGGVRFWLAAPSSGRFRAFFDFQLGGVVRTASFTFQVP